MVKSKTKFKEEFRRQLRLAVAAAIGFIIAYSWRDFILELSKDTITRITSTLNVHLINLSSSLFITIVGVIVILISSKILQK